MISTAIKRGLATPEQVRTAVETMAALNADAAAAMVEARASAATDVTGFGLLGHLRAMLEASGMAAWVDAAVVPLLPGTVALARRDVVAGGTKRNLAWLNETTDWGALTPPERLVLADAQTSGGMLIATLDPDGLRSALEGRGVLAVEVGAVEPGPHGRVTVRGRLPDTG
jgi:selenide,water dikinase